jgi:hypothetical protein
MKRYAKHAAYAGIAIVFLWTVFWMVTAQNIVRRIETWRTVQTQAGVTLAWDELDIKGWPFGWRATVDKPRAAGAGPSAWSWSGERLTASLDPRNLRAVAVRLPGLQNAAFGAGDLETKITVRAARPDARLAFDAEGKVTSLTLDFEALEATLDGSAPLAMRKLDATLAPNRPANPDHRSDTLDLNLLAQGVRLAAPVPGLGRDIARAEFVGNVKGKIAGPGAKLGPALRAWRDDGGTLEVKLLGLDWGPAHLTAEGTLALDEQDRPLGAGTIRIAGWRETIDVLQAARIIEPGPAAILKIGLGFLGRTGGTNDGSVQVPLAAQDGRLIVQRVPVMALPRLDLD